MAKGRSNAASRSNSGSGGGSYQQTQKWNADGSFSTITQPYAPPTKYTQSDRNVASSTAADASTNLSSDEGWAGFFKGNSPLAVRKFGVDPNNQSVANAAGVTNPEPSPTNAASVTNAAPIDAPVTQSNGFSFGAGAQGLQASPTPMTAADHINQAVTKGIAATNALGLQVPQPGRTFGSANASSVAMPSGGAQAGDTIVSKYGTGSVTSANPPANAADRLKRLAAPDTSDLTNIYG